MFYLEYLNLFELPKRIKLPRYFYPEDLKLYELLDIYILTYLFQNPKLLIFLFVPHHVPYLT